MSSHIVARIAKPAIIAAISAVCLGPVAVPVLQAATSHAPAGTTVVADSPTPTATPDNSQWT